MRPINYAVVLIGFIPFALQAQTETEPNDTMTQANFWPENTELSGTSCFAGGEIDVDWYVLVPSEEGILTVTAVASNNTSGIYGIALQFFAKDGVSLFWNTSAPSGPDPLTTQISAYCVPNDTLFLKTFVLLDHCEYYTISYAITPPAFADDVEDNDDLSQATPLAPDTWTEGRVQFAYDDGVDYYSMEVPESGRYTLTVEATYQTTGIEVNGLGTELQDANGNLMANWTAQVGANTVLTTTNSVSCVGAGTVNLKVWFGSFFGCGIAYRFKWELDPTVFNDDPEPNNTASQANYFPPDVSRPGVAGDQDWWKLYKSYTGDLQLTVRAAFIGAGTGNFTVQVFNPAQQLLYNGNVDPGQNNVPTSYLITVPSAGPDSFYVDIYSNSFDCGSYELSYSSLFDGVGEQVGQPGVVIVLSDPSRDVFTFQWNGTPVAWLSISDMQGRVVAESEINGTSTFTWDATPMAAGSYLARITTSDGSNSIVRLIRTH